MTEVPKKQTRCDYDQYAMLLMCFEINEIGPWNRWHAHFPKWNFIELLIKPKLERANLEGADLSEAMLRGANLSGANLKAAKFGSEYPKYAMIRDEFGKVVVLQGADLSGANLEGAVLEGAMLRGVNLEGARIINAHLEKAIFDFVSVDGNTAIIN